jgi:hypothetical protein
MVSKNKKRISIFFYFCNEMNEYGFIILRHVNSETTNQIWNHCYHCIRTYYPERPVVIIDDNSKQEYVVATNPMYNTTVVQSEYPSRGELLPYYYYANNPWFDMAIILHDSVFINHYIDFQREGAMHGYRFLWEFEHYWDDTDGEQKMMDLFDDLELQLFYESKHLWKGCFGGMTMIPHDYLVELNRTYDLRKLLDICKSRGHWERVLGCLLQKKERLSSLLGNIHSYCRIGISFEERNSDETKHLPLIKIFVGR